MDACLEIDAGLVMIQAGWRFDIDDVRMGYGDLISQGISEDDDAVRRELGERTQRIVQRIDMLTRSTNYKYKYMLSATHL